jgi:hypothetical protein
MFLIPVVYTGRKQIANATDSQRFSYLKPLTASR